MGNSYSANANAQGKTGTDGLFSKVTELFHGEDDKLPSATFDDLPLDLLPEILAKLPYPDAVRARKVNRALNEAGLYDEQRRRGKAADMLLSPNVPWHQLNESMPAECMHRLATLAAEVGEHPSRTMHRTGLVFKEQRHRQTSAHRGGTITSTVHTVIAYRNDSEMPVLRTTEETYLSVACDGQPSDAYSCIYTCWTRPSTTHAMGMQLVTHTDYGPGPGPGLFQKQTFLLCKPAKYAHKPPWRLQKHSLDTVSTWRNQHRTAWGIDTVVRLRRQGTRRTRQPHCSRVWRSCNAHWPKRRTQPLRTTTSTTSSTGPLWPEWPSTGPRIGRWMSLPMLATWPAPGLGHSTDGERPSTPSAPSAPSAPAPVASQAQPGAGAGPGPR